MLKLQRVCHIIFLTFAALLISCQQKVNFGLQPSTESFAQSISYNNKVDIVWVMDNSSSMKKYQTSLSQQAVSFVQKLNDAKLDYHMAVITSSMGSGGNGGQFLGSPNYITNATANAGSALASLLVVGENGDNLNRGLDSLLTVTSSSYSTKAPGFFRSDAYLSVVVLSDGNDYSSRNNDDVISFFDSIKAKWIDGTRSWSISYLGMISDTPQCRTFGNYSDVGLVWNDLADRSEGIKESICAQDYSVIISNLRSRIMQVLTDYRLSKVPAVNTIKVLINGSVVPMDATNGWTYESSKNLIRFHGTYVPPADASIKVDFTPAEAN